jgi:hypothetical protein
MVQDRPILYYLQKILDSLPNAFAQLVFLSSLRDSHTGRYVYEGWAGISNPEEVNMVLRATHRSIFESIVSLPVMALSRELRKHFRSLVEDEIFAAHFWLDTEPYYKMIPEGCSQVSRTFFISQFRLALEILIEAPAWEYLEDRGSSPGPVADEISPAPWLN